MSEGVYRSCFNTDGKHLDYAGPASEASVERFLAATMESGLKSSGRVCYVLGTGDQPKSFYDEMRRNAGVEVIFCGSLLPWPLSWMPSHRGLVKVLDLAKLSHAFKRMAEQSTAILYVFDARLETRFVGLARSEQPDRDHTLGVADDPGFLIYLLDENRDDSPTGAIEYIVCGADGPWADLVTTYR